jgi:biopolymer transport protein ExbB
MMRKALELLRQIVSARPAIASSGETSMRDLVTRLARPLERIRCGQVLHVALLSAVVVVLLSVGSFAEDAAPGAQADPQKVLDATVPPAMPAGSTASDHAGNAAQLSPVAAPPPAASPALSAPTGVNVGPLPDELSPWGMFLHADIVVKAVIVGLALASIATWTVLLVKTIQLRLERRAAQAAVTVLLSSRSLVGAIRQLGVRRNAVMRLVAAAEDELEKSHDLAAEGIKERVAWEFERLQGAAARQIGRGMGVLATIGAVAPFVGLFGTVWGIMNSFVGISRAHTTNLAVVAPGIAEALLATAFGLVAAIPAVIYYNRLTHNVKVLASEMDDFAMEFLNIAERNFT